VPNDKIVEDDVDPDALTAAEREALAAWDAPAPPAGFAARLAGHRPARTTSETAVPVRVGAPRRRVAIASAVLAAAAAAAIAIAVTGGGDPARAGAISALERRSLSLAGRAVAVAEPGAVLAWAIDDRGAIRVEQGAGEVFYRVDHGGPFVVATPLGEVRVTGTCFRVEVIMKPSKQSLIGGTIGAALAAAVVVTVYEGGVVVAGRDGGTAKVSAGERASLSAGGGGPSVAGDGSGGTATAVTLAAPAADATREQLLVRDELQRRQIAALTSRIGDLERGGGGAAGPDSYPSGRPFFDPTHEDLVELAKRCEVRVDMPPVMGGAPSPLNADEGGDYGLTPAELAEVDAVMAAMHRSWNDRVRAIYLEATGDAPAEGMSAQAMWQEISDKSDPRERQALSARIANERAGLVQPPADWSHASPYERMFRGMLALGDEAEKLISEKLGAGPARELRGHDGGWPAKWTMTGCHDGPPDAE
jgi:hypothetical protein